MRLLPTLFSLACLTVQVQAFAQIDSVILSPAAAQFFPYCSGERPSTIEVRYKTSVGTTFNPDNVFMLEVSDISGNFDGHYGGRFVGTAHTNLANDTLHGVRMPDNLPFNPGFTPTTPGHYRVRLVSTSPAFTSAISAEIAQWQLCPLRIPKMYSSTLRPLRNAYHSGDSVEMTVYRDPATLVIQPGDMLRVQLSDTNGIFRGVDVATQLIDSIPAVFTGDSVIVHFRIPSGLPPAFRYRIRPTLTSDPNTASSTSTGHDVPVRGTLIATKSRLETKVEAWPVPATNTLCWRLPQNAGSVLKTQLVSSTGEIINLPEQSGKGNLTSVPKGNYVLLIQTDVSVYVTRIVKE